MENNGTCEHCEFSVFTKVTKLTNDDKITGYAADFRVSCSQCGAMFVFRGPLGISPRHPTVSTDGLTLHAPLAPETDPAFGEDGIGLAIQLVSSNPRMRQ